MFVNPQEILSGPVAWGRAGMGKEEATGIPFKTYCGKDQAMLSSDIFFKALSEVLFVLLRGCGRRIGQAGKSLA
jgi:hypothetical protein